MSSKTFQIVYECSPQITQAYFDADIFLIGQAESLEMAIGQCLMSAVREREELCFAPKFDELNEVELGRAIIRGESPLRDTVLSTREIKEPILELRKLWAMELPEEFENFGPFMSEKIIPRSALFEFLESQYLSDQEHQKMDYYLDLLDGKTHTNFFFRFCMHSTMEVMSGRYLKLSSSHTALQPFYINKIVPGAWDRMCERFPEETRIAAEYASQKWRTGGTETLRAQALSALATLGLYLHKEEGIPAPFFLA